MAANDLSKPSGLSSKIVPTLDENCRRGCFSLHSHMRRVSELAGERWQDVAEQASADRLRGLGRRRDACASLVHGWANSPAEDSGVTSRFRYRILNARLAAGISAMGSGHLLKPPE
jgi:hypothetical protein